MNITDKENMIYAEAEYEPTWEEQYNINKWNVSIGGFVVGALITWILLHV